ncbi:MAG TPA: hypothetical protein VGD58_02840 [Herpetosiphonaceae bacterium]
MRRLMSVALMLALVLPITISAQTVPPAPPAGVVLQLAGSGAETLTAGTWCGVYELADGGARWREVSGLRDIPARQLLRLPSNVLLVGTGGWWPGGLWRHAPGGTWERVLDQISVLAANASGTRVYAVRGESAGPSGVQAVVLRSDDGGRTWAEASRFMIGAAVPVDMEVARDPISGEDLLLIAYQFGKAGGSSVTLSRDRGVTWQGWSVYANNLLQTDFPRLSLDRDLTTVYVANTRRDFSNGTNTTRLFRGAAAGTTLEEIPLPDALRQHGVVDFVAQDDTVIAAGTQSVYRYLQDKGGGTWAAFDPNLGSPTIFDLHITADRAIYAGTSIGVYRYDSPSALWQAAGSGLPVCTTPGRTVYEPLDPFPDSPERRFFSATGHSLSYGFKSFWEANGGLPVFGLPLSEEFDERNVDLQRAFTTQYLERERFEYHPENADTPFTVLLGRLGDELLRAQGRDWRLEDGTANPFPGGTGGCQLFDVGGERRSVCGPFLQYWRTHGLDLGRRGVTYEESLLLFGLPLTAPRLETNPDGDQVLTQWFERARFEYHPNNPEPYKVLLGRLGAETLRARGVALP